MRISVKVKAKALKNKVEKKDKDNFTVFVKEIPEKGKANRGVIRELAGYFKVSKLQIEIISGLASSKKIIKIDI